MSSGLYYYYDIRSADEDTVPVQFTLSKPWATGHVDLPVKITHINGLESMRHCYLKVPGLGGQKELWLDKGMKGSLFVAHAASEILLADNPNAQIEQRLIPKPSGYTVGEFIYDRSILGGLRIAEYAGIPASASFREAWSDFAVAIESAPRQIWKSGLRLSVRLSQSMEPLPRGNVDAVRALVAAYLIANNQDGLATMLLDEVIDLNALGTPSEVSSLISRAKYFLD